MQEVAEDKGMVSSYGEEVSENIFEDLVEAAEVTVDLMACAQQDGYLGKLEVSCFSAVIVLSVIVCNTPPLFAANHYHRRRRFSGFCRCGCSANGSRTTASTVAIVRRLASAVWNRLPLFRTWLPLMHVT
jgi:hypothetical protein